MRRGHGRFPVKEVWLPGHVHTSLTFERCLDAILDSDAGYHEPRAGEAFQVGSARVEVVHPASATGDLNNDSIAVRILYGDVVLLFTGDVEAPAEAAMVAAGAAASAHVLHMGHHGSRTSSTAPFLAAVAPEVAIYSAGAGNSYGHPHPEALAAGGRGRGDGVRHGCPRHGPGDHRRAPLHGGA